MTKDALAVRSAPRQKTRSDDEDWGSFFRFLAKLVLAVAIFRSFIFSPFTIPSESMLPGLRNGDYLVAAKWPYGYSRVSLPFQLPLIPGRIFADLPERGDVVIFKHPIDGTDYVKRVIGLPGDTVALRGGQVILNGQPLPQQALPDFELATSANTICNPAAEVVQQDGVTVACRYDQRRETLPSGRSYPILDFGPRPQDDFAPVIVPDGTLFVMGDNRDNSMDSRFPAAPGGGVGLVDADLLVGRASMVLWSTDGSAEWLLPWTWFTAARWNRIGSSI
ncbi:signal peptidase I [Qipengyuania sp.]|uniref:signal peptidase I n=1 Tax=Qipengyuania sp. TaxID=2004515 RepID=UPI003736E8D0